MTEHPDKGTSGDNRRSAKVFQGIADFALEVAGQLWTNRPGIDKLPLREGRSPNRKPQPIGAAFVS